jgi:hypothetical protein
MPAPPQTSGSVHGPQSICVPQPSPAGPHSMPWLWQVIGVQVG